MKYLLILNLIFLTSQNLLAHKTQSRFERRRAAYHQSSLIRDRYFSAGRSEQVRRQLVSLYRNLLADLGNPEEDPELWSELKKEIPWARLGLKSPKLFFGLPI